MSHKKAQETDTRGTKQIQWRFVWSFCVSLLCLFVANAVYAQTDRRPLTPQEQRGKAFYLRGESSSGQDVTAIMNDIDVPASTLTCAGCHGVRGQGQTEGGITAGNLRWSNLIKPYGHTHDNGRKHGAFSEADFIRSVTSGIDPNGNKLAVAMPAYRMPQQEMADLIAYLKRIETDLDPGVSDSNIVIGTLLPDKNAMTGLGQAVEDILKAYFAEINDRGGIYNRRIELRVVNGNTGATVANMQQLIDDGHVFAMVSGLMAGAEAGVAKLSREREVPLIGPSTLLPERSLPVNRYVFYLLPGLKEQARSLVNFAAKKSDRRRLAIVSPDNEFNRGIAASIEEQAKKLGWATNVYWGSKNVVELKEQGVESVFLLGGGAEAAAFFKAADALAWTPNVYLLGTLVGRSAPELASARMKDHVFFAFPTVPSDVTVTGVAEYGGLLHKHKLSPVHSAAQVSALAAAKILVHALERCGKDLTREKLITTLEGLYEFDTGLSPKITFGPNRRLGMLGAYVVTMDPEKKQFPANVEWVSVD
jgi:ABC-type branched-subunit amino acid transport system substrate-binding protein